MIEPRDYQQRALDILVATLSRHAPGTCHPVIEAPTGAGKALIQAMILARYPGRFVCLTHVAELVSQNYEELLGFDCTADAGIYHAGIGRRETDNRITFCGIHSVHKKAHALGRIDAIIIDEAHLVPHTNQTMYRRFIDAARGFNPAVTVIGLSATPWRLNNGYLNQGEGALFTDIITAKACGMDVLSLIKRGYLSPVTTAPVATRLNTEGVKKTGGDFNAKQLAAAVDKQTTNQAAVAEILAFGQGRKSWLVFATSVAHAYHLADLLADHVSVDVITGETPKDERDRLTKQFKDGDIKCLVNVNVLTTGFNAPAVDLVAFLRPTQSASLYCQMTGRGMRTAWGKDDCLILDFAGNIERHGPVDNITVKPPRKKTGEHDAPIKECPECFMLVPASATTCIYCAFEFPKAAPKIESKATTAPILSTDARMVYPITRWRFSIHRKEGGTASLKVSYFSGLRKVADEWICLFHEGFAQRKAQAWWDLHVGDLKYTSLDDAVRIGQEFGKMPGQINVDTGGKYPRIVARSFDTSEAA